MVNRMRCTRAHTRNRRSHHGLKEPVFIRCEDCGHPRQPHRVCGSCGRYRKRKVAEIEKITERGLKRQAAKREAKGKDE